MRVGIAVDDILLQLGLEGLRGQESDGSMDGRVQYRVVLPLADRTRRQTHRVDPHAQLGLPPHSFLTVLGSCVVYVVIGSRRMQAESVLPVVLQGQSGDLVKAIACVVRNRGVLLKHTGG
jgi:hypothetical protein